MDLIVQKYGGSSVADAVKIKNVSRRIARTKEAGYQVVVVVSAMGDTTDDLVTLAYQINQHPDMRELDVLLSTGEVVSSTLLAMALHAMEYPAISLSGAQAGISTDTAYNQARITNINPVRVEQELEKVMERKLPINVDGAIAAIISDMGFDWRLGKAFFVLGRVAGLTAQVYEEQTQEKPMRKMANVDCEYIGPQERKLP